MVLAPVTVAEKVALAPTAMEALTGWLVKAGAVTTVKEACVEVTVWGLAAAEPVRTTWYW